MIKNYKVPALIISLTAFGYAFVAAPVANAVYSGYHDNTTTTRRNTIPSSAYVTSTPQDRCAANQENCPHNESSDCPYANEKHEARHYYYNSATQKSQSQARGHNHRVNRQGQHRATREDCPYAIE